MKNTALVIFGQSLSSADKKQLFSVAQYDIVIAPSAFQSEIESHGFVFVNIESFIDPGSIYAANMLVQELSLLTLNDGLRITQSVVYEGYELWWIHYNSLFHASCLPYTQYKKLLEFLGSFQRVYLFESPHETLFASYLSAYRCEFSVLRTATFNMNMLLPFGIFIQMAFTLLSLPLLMLQRKNVMIFTGDKFAATKDYDSRMSFIYDEMRNRGIPFMEFVRSLESWRTVVLHAVTRKRPVVYSVPLQYVGRCLSVVTGAGYRRKKVVDAVRSHVRSEEEHFKLLLGTQYLYDVDADIWTIRIAKLVLWCIGVRAVFVPAATERNLHTVIACKLLGIPTVGVLHGTPTRDYNVYDFLPTYDGERAIALDTYGLWSDWWKSYYEENSRAYRKEQLFISGPMRPLVRESVKKKTEKQEGHLKVLFISEQLAAPSEILPYIRALLDHSEISLYMKFRPYRDGFETWLQEHHPEIIIQIGEEKIFRGDMKTATSLCDIVVGTHSTAVLEALLVEKPVAFFATEKWGDCFELKGYHPQYTFYAQSTDELIACVKTSGSIPVEVLRNLQERFFGDPYQNGSKWVVDQLVGALKR